MLVVGAGLMGSQIGVEYALGGHDVTLTARRPAGVEERVDAALATVETYGLATAVEVRAARGRITVGVKPEPAGWAIVVESVPEELSLKASVLAPVAEASPDAILASNASSLSITELGEAVGAPARTIGTHYWNPPLLMPLVEVIPGAGTDPLVVERVREVVLALGKRPVLVERDVPGFVWNRLQFALLRECVWLVENGSPRRRRSTRSFARGSRGAGVTSDRSRRSRSAASTTGTGPAPTSRPSCPTSGNCPTCVSGPPRTATPSPTWRGGAMPRSRAS